jgi:hypothetical protein
MVRYCKCRLTPRRDFKKVKKNEITKIYKLWTGEVIPVKAEVKIPRRTVL